MIYKKSEPIRSWYNYRTESYDHLSQAPSDFQDYIPQNPAAINMYNLLIKMGETPLEAVLHVFNECIGTDWKQKTHFRRSGSFPSNAVHLN